MTVKATTKTTTSIRLDDGIKKEVVERFRSMGLNLSSGIEIYLREVIRQNKIPFEVHADDTFLQNSLEIEDSNE